MSKRIGDWVIEESQLLGHRVVRSAVCEALDLHVVLSCGSMSEPGPTQFEAPPELLAWLLRGDPEPDEQPGG